MTTVEHADGGLKVSWSQVRVSLSHLNRAVTEQLADVQQRYSLHHQPTGEGVSEVVDAKVGDTGTTTSRLKC